MASACDSQLLLHASHPRYSTIVKRLLVGATDMFPKSIFLVHGTTWILRSIPITRTLFCQIKMFGHHLIQAS